MNRNVMIAYPSSRHYLFVRNNVFVHYVDRYEKEIIIRFEKGLKTCIRYIVDVAPRLTVYLEKYDKGDNVEIDLLIIRSILSFHVDKTSGINSDYLLSHVLQNVCNTLQEESFSLSIIEQALQLANDLLPHLLFIISDKTIPLLWSFMWSSKHQSVTDLLFQFFETSIPFISQTFYASFIDTAMQSASFSVSLKRWECCCHIWKALNDVNVYMEMKMPVTNVKGFVRS